jgi:hypothetical protein
LVLHKDGTFYALDPKADAWEKQRKEGMPFALSGSGHRGVATPAAIYGVTFFFTAPCLLVWTFGGKEVSGELGRGRRMGDRGHCRRRAAQ